MEIFGTPGGGTALIIDLEAREDLLPEVRAWLRPFELKLLDLAVTRGSKKFVAVLAKGTLGTVH